MKIKIPEKIEIIGSTIDIIWDEDYCEEHDLMGSANMNHNTITLRKKYKNTLLKDDAISETFIHELVHVILRKTGRGDELNEDETFIVPFSNALHQVIKQL